MKYFKSFLIFLSVICLTSCVLNFNFGNEEVLDEIKINTDLKVHFLDVGQGDAIFIELPNNETMLIDAGEKSEEEKVLEYIDNLNYEKIDYVVGTHPHTDHIGGLAYIIENKKIGNIYLPKVAHNSKTYENLLLTIKNKKKQVIGATKDMKIINSKDLKIFILAPTNGESSNLNNYSIVIKIVFKNNSFLFMGDAEESVERTLTNVTADVIKVGHHGSDSSSSQNFLNKVNPKYAVISVGKDNQYNHPSLDIIKRYEKMNCQIFRTDINGNIVFTSDGNTLNIMTEKGEKK